MTPAKTISGRENAAAKAKPDPALLLIFFVVFLDLLGFTILMPVETPMMLDTGANAFLPASTSLADREFLIGLLLMVYPLAQFFAAPILGLLSDKHGRKKILAVCLAGGLVSYVLFAIGIITKNIPLLFAARILAGLTGGSIAVAMSAVADISTRETKAKNFGIVGTAFGLGFIIGPFLGGVLADPNTVSWFAYWTPFAFAAILTAANLLFLQLRFRETLKTPMHVKVSLLTGAKQFAKALSSQNLRALFSVGFLFILGFNFYTSFSLVYMSIKFGYTSAQMGILFAYMGVWIVVTQMLILGPVLKRFPPKKVLTMSLLGLAIAIPAMLLPSEAWMVYLIVPFISICNGLTNPTYNASVSNLARDDEQGEVMGMSQSVSSLAMAIPPLVAGVIVQWGIGIPTLVAGALVFLSWLVYIAFVK